MEPALTVNAGLKQLHFSWAAVAGATYYRLVYSADGVAGFVPLTATSASLSTTAFDWDIAVHRLNWPQAKFRLEACCSSSGCLPSTDISALNVMVNAIGYLKASNAGAGDSFGAVALSADGNTLAVSAPGESSAATGINNTMPGQNDNSADLSGAVYVFTRSGTTWSQQAYMKASNTGITNYFGTSLALSADGNTLAVGAWGR